MLKVQLTQTQILDLIILGIKNSDYENTINFIQDVIKEINKEEENQNHEHLRLKNYTSNVINKLKREENKRGHLNGINETNIEKFEIGKYYKHSSGKIIHILGRVETTSYGYCLVAETSSGVLVPVGEHDDAIIGWEELTREEWMKNFS